MINNYGWIIDFVLSPIATSRGINCVWLEMFANEGIHASLRWFSQISEIIHISYHKLSWNYQLHSLPVSPNPVLLLYRPLYMYLLVCVCR